MSRGPNVRALILNGQCGSGKSTQACRLRAHAERLGLGVATVAVDDAVERITNGNTTDHPWDEFISSIAPQVLEELCDECRGGFLSDDLTGRIVSYLVGQISETPSPDLLIFDGFPHTSAQVKTATKILADAGVRIGIGGNAFFVRLQIKPETCASRLVRRADSGAGPDFMAIKRRMRAYDEHQYSLRTVVPDAGLCFLQVGAIDHAEEDVVTKRIISTLPDMFFCTSVARHLNTGVATTAVTS